MRLPRERVLCGAPFAALLVAADKDRVLMRQPVELLILIAAKRRAAEMAIDLQPAPRFARVLLALPGRAA